MRLYLNKKEVKILKEALDMIKVRSIVDADVQTYDTCNLLIDRIELCEQLQQNEKEGARK